VVDWVGSDSYPNTADFAEEVRHLCASRRLPRTLDFPKLTKDSRLVLVHARAFIANHNAYYMASGWSCPKDLDEHSAANGGRLNAIPDGMCAGLWWQDVVPNGGDSFDTNGDRAVRRQMPSFGYEAKMPPPGVTAQYRPAVFMRLPIRNLAVIRAEDGSHEEAVSAASRSGLDVNLEDS
jgi:hypothetical protein